MSSSGSSNLSSKASTMPLVTVHGVDDVRLDSVPLPQCGDNDVLVAVKNCGICGSDLGYIAMGGLLGPGNPMPLGHELSAVVEQTGRNVDSVKVGDRVVVNPMGVEPPIGNMGPEGGFAPQLLVRDVANNPQALFVIDASIGDELGALVEPLAVGMHGVHQGEASERDKAVIFGAGTIGMSIAIVLRHYGLKDIVVVDTSESRLARAETLGVKTFVAGSGNLAEFLMEAHGAAQYFGADVPGSTLYFEATGVGKVFDQIVALACENARVVIVGLHKSPVSLDLATVLSKQLTVRGAMAYPDEFPQVIDMLKDIDLDPSVLITHRFGLTDFHQALETARDTQKSVKVMIDCQQ